MNHTEHTHHRHENQHTHRDHHDYQAQPWWERRLYEQALIND